jgi:hypothetical protein
MVATPEPSRDYPVIMIFTLGEQQGKADAGRAHSVLSRTYTRYTAMIYEPCKHTAENMLSLGAGSTAGWRSFSPDHTDWPLGLPGVSLPKLSICCVESEK